MKQILSFLLFLLPALAFAQWPAAPNKIRLGNQTTGDGLIVRTDSIPDWTPADRNNAWLAFDTVANLLYFYEGGTWQEYASGTIIDSLTTTADSIFLYTSAGVFSDALPAPDLSAYVEGSGTTNALAKWLSSTSLGNSLMSDDGARVTAGGTAGLVLPSGTTAQRSGTPVNGETRRNTTTNFGETFDGTNWRQAEFPVGTAAGNTTYFNGTNWVQSGNIFNNNGNVGIGTTTPGRKLSVSGTTSLMGNTTVSADYPNNSYASLTVFPPNTTPSTYGGALFVGARAALQYSILNQDFTTEVTGGKFYPSEPNSGFIPLIAVGGNNSKIFRSQQSGFGAIGGAFTSGVLSGTRNGVGLIAQAYTSQLVNNNTAIGFISTAWADKGDLSGTLIGALIEARGDSVDVTNTRTYTASQFRVTGPELTTKIGIDIDFIGAGTKRAIISRQGDNLLAGKTRIGNITEADEALHVTGKVKIDTLTDTAESLAGYTGTTGPGVATRVSTGVGLSLSGGTLSAQNLGNSDLTNTSALRTYTIPNTHTLDFIDQGGGNNFLARFSNRGFLTADKPTLLLQIRDSVSTNFSNLLLTPDSVDLFANKLTLKMPPLDATPTRLLTIDPSTREVKYVLKDSIGGSGGPANLAYTGTADVIELDAGGTPVFIAEGSGVDVTQSGDTLTITGKGTRFVQDSITGATLTIDLNEAPTAIISLKMTSATSVTLTISNPYGFLTDATAPTYEGETGVYTFRFWGISGTDNVTWPANFYDMNGTALGTDALTAGTAYTCYYDPIANEYYCK